MHISSSQVALSSGQNFTQQVSVNQTLRVFQGNPDLPPASASSEAAQAASAQVQISAAAQSALSGSDGTNKLSSTDPRMMLLISLLEALFGKKIALADTSDLGNKMAAAGNVAIQTPAPAAQAASQGMGMIYTADASITNTTDTSFQASGTVTTDDNRQIHFNLSFSVQTSTQQSSSITVKAGTALQDPLVVNFTGQSVQLSDKTFAFDLNNNGHMVQLPYIQGGGYLALNPPGSQSVNSQTRLFGPQSGNGFAQLQTLDSDGNSWIDGSDPSMQNLGIVTQGADGKPVFTSLKNTPVAALYIGNASTLLPVASNTSSGQLTSSGVWLSNDGQAGSLQQVDLMV